MLINFIINSIDTMNLIYLWIFLSRKNHNILKLVSSILILSISVTIIENFELNFVISYIVGIILIKFMYKSSLKEAILGFVLALLTDISFELVFSLIINKFTYNDTYIAIISELLSLAAIIIISKTNLFKKNFIFEIMDNNALIYFILVCFAYAGVFKIIWNYDENIILNNLLSISLIFCTLAIAQILAYLYLLKLIKEKETLKITNEYNEIINEIVQEIKQRQHDFVNYKNTIRGILEVIEEKDVIKTIKNYMKDEDIYDNKINELIYIDNVVIKSIIYMNICKAKKHNINFEYEIENNVLDSILSYNEISNILNNLLNNAFDEISKDECNEKDIKVKIFNSEKTSHLIIKNKIADSNNINVNDIFTRGYTTKNTKGTRGYGLHNVQQIINMHKGYIKINIEHGEIIFDIYFNKSSG